MIFQSGGENTVLIAIRRLAILICLMSLPSSPALASPATTSVEISNRAYRDIERLVAFGLCDPPMIDQRPLARGEFARLIAEAQRNFDGRARPSSEGGDYERLGRELSRDAAIARTLARLSSEFAEEIEDIGAAPGERPLLRMHPIEELRLDAIYQSAAPLAIIQDNGVGSVQANVGPFLHYREGRHATDGFQTAIETTHRLKISQHLALTARAGQPNLLHLFWRSSLWSIR